MIQTKTWEEFLLPDKYDLEKSCYALKQHALKFHVTQQQENALSEILKQYMQDDLFAVRSSSPEEDLEGASFAGGYETVLGVLTSPYYRKAALQSTY